MGEFMVLSIVIASLLYIYIIKKWTEYFKLSWIYFSSTEVWKTSIGLVDEETRLEKLKIIFIFNENYDIISKRLHSGRVLAMFSISKRINEMSSDVNFGLRRVRAFSVCRTENNQGRNVCSMDTSDECL